MVFASGDYAELLGLYLGDGCVSATARTYGLRLSLDAGHPRVLARSRDLLVRCFVENGVSQIAVGGSQAVVLSVYSQHMPCLFPQHGAGKKHHRRIVLEPWQQVELRTAPWSFLRGCINSDGCYFTNRTGRYSYQAYQFVNLSSDILDLFVGACDLVGVEYRRYDKYVRINRRSSVALFERNAGTKG